MAALLLAAAPPDAGGPTKPKAAPKADAGAAKLSAEDEQIIKDLELLENLDVLRKLDQVDVDE